MHVEWRALFKSRVADLRHWCTVDRRVDTRTQQPSTLGTPAVPGTG